jgi:hypothetical protein
MRNDLGLGPATCSRRAAKTSREVSVAVQKISVVGAVICLSSRGNSSADDVLNLFPNNFHSPFNRTALCRKEKEAP